MSDGRDGEDAVRRAADLENRTVIGGAPVGGGSTTVSSGAYDTVAGGDLGGPGARDPGDSAGDLRPESADTDGSADTSDLDRAEAERLAQQVFGEAGGTAGAGSGAAGEDGAASRGLGGLGGDHSGSGVAGLGGLAPGDEPGGAGGLDSRNLGGGGAGMGQTQGVARQNQAFGLGGDQPQDPSAMGGANEQQDELRAHAAAQGRRDADDAQGLLDKTRAQTDVGDDPNNNAR